MSTKTTDPEINAAARDAALALLPPIFGRCLDPEASRYSLWAPFILDDGHVYATDGRIAVRTPATPEARVAVEAITPRSRVPDVTVVFGPPELYEPTPLPVPDLKDAPVCRNCEGEGAFEKPEEVECPRCLGDMFEPLVDGFEDDWEGDTCHKCFGEGTVPGKTGRLVLVTCGRCEGGGYFDDARGSKSMLVHGKAELAYAYLAILRDAGAVLHFQVSAPRRQGVRFVAPGGVEGVVMPLVRGEAD